MICEEHGYFWWGDARAQRGRLAPKSAIAGVLKIDDDGRAELELHGMLNTATGPMAALFSDNPLALDGKAIHGVLKNTNQHVRLDGLLRNGGQLTSNGISFEKYLAATCLVGSTPFPKTTRRPMRFSALHVDLDGFESWLRLGSMKAHGSATEISATFKVPKNQTYRVHDGTLSMRYHMTGPLPNLVLEGHAFTLKASASLVYALAKLSSLDDIVKEFGLIQDLLILLTGSDYNVEWPTLRFGTKDAKCQLYFLRHRSQASAPVWHDCWTHFPQLREDFGRIFSAWKRKREEYGPGFYLYLGTRRGIKMYVEHRFVNLVWGIESLHRKVSNTAQSAKLSEKIDRILGQIQSEKDRKWLEGRLKHAHEPALEQRIFETISRLPLGLDENRLRAFSNQCARYRNDISHFGSIRVDGEPGKPLEATAHLNDALSYLYHALLLHEIGVKPEILKWWFFDGYRSYQIKQTLAEVGLVAKANLSNTRAAKETPAK